MTKLVSSGAADEWWLAQKTRGNLTANIQFLRASHLLSSKAKVLEIGCGKGALLSDLYKRNIEIFGCDHRMHQTVGDFPKHRVVCADGASLPFAESSFDVVLSFDVFEHIPDSDEHLSEVRRVLRPRGCYAFETPNIITNTPFEILRTSMHFGFRKVMSAFQPPQHCALHSYWGLRRRIKKNKFEVEFYDVKVVNEYFMEKVRTYGGNIGAIAVKHMSPDRLPLPFRTNFFAVARRAD